MTLAAIVAFAQQSPEKADRKKALAEMQAYRREFLVKELEMTKEQQNAFFPIYDKMNAELQKIADDTRALDRSLSTDATDAELDAASMMQFAQKQREGAVEMEYYDRFKKVLTSKQLYKLKGAERRFTRHLMKHHRKAK